MIHTATISTLLTRTEYEQLRRDHKTKIISENEICNTALREQGISYLFASCKYEIGYCFYYCKAKINLERIANHGKQTPFAFTVSEDNKRKLKENFKKIISRILPDKVDINTWHVNRIDYTIDIETPYVKEYITMLQRGGKPYKSRIDAPKGKDGKEQHKSETEKTHYKNSVRYKNKSCLIQIYDKYEERKTIQEYPLKLLDECKNILRVEIQCFYNKTRTIKKKFELRGTSLFPFMLSKEQQKRMFTYYLRCIGGYGNYMNLLAAVNVIQKSKLKNDTKQKAISLLTEINTAKSVWKVKRKYGNRIDSIFLALKRINVNPVTIPRRYTVKELKNLFQLIDEEKSNPNNK